jgi:hypothetical protein
MSTATMSSLTQPTAAAAPAVVVQAPSQGPSVVIVSSAFMGLNTFFILLRVYTRATVSKNFNFNDVFMMLAVVRTSCFYILLSD